MVAIGAETGVGFGLSGDAGFACGFAGAAAFSASAKLENPPVAEGLVDGFGALAAGVAGGVVGLAGGVLETSVEAALVATAAGLGADAEV